MNTNQTESGETLVLTDDAGNYYAIPVEDLERYRVRDEQKGLINDSLGDEVAGFMMNPMYSSFVNQQVASQHQEEMAKAAKASRDVAAANETPTIEESPGTERRRMPAIRRVFTGVLASLKF